MKCKCKYFLMKDGVRVCSVCGKPAHVVEEKNMEAHEDKALKAHDTK